jgi:hypothetical protein
VSKNAELVRAWHKAAEMATDVDRLEDLLALTHPQFEMTESSPLPGAAHVKALEALRSYCYGWAETGQSGSGARRGWSICRQIG